jgi:lauroyl/myristoyl acyltransferase
MLLALSSSSSQNPARTEGGTVAAPSQTPAARAGDIPVPQDDRVEGVGLPARAYASPLVHRLLPAGVAVELAARVGPAMRQRRNPAERDDAQAFMRQLLAHTPRAGEADELAVRWLAEKSRMGELFWRPWLLREASVAGLEHWNAAREGGRGVVMVFGHILGAWTVPGIMGSVGMPVYIVIGPHYYAPMPPGYEGLALLHRRRAWGEDVLQMDHIVLATGRPERFKELVDGGGVVAVAFDAPGRAPTPFLGRTVGFGGAAPRLALETGAKVLPAIPERHGTRLVMRFYEPIDPADYKDTTSLRAAIAAAFEPVVLERPETVELAWIPCPLVTEVPEQAPSGVGA